MFEFEITELQRRLANIVRIGRVAETDYSGIIPKVRVHIDPLTTAWLPLITLRAGPDKSWWPVDVNEQVIVLSPSGELNQGIVLGSICQQRFPAAGNTSDVHRMTYADGAVIEYDRAAHALKAELPSGATTDIISDGGLSVVGDVTISGALTVSDNATIAGETTLKKNLNVSGLTKTAGLATGYITTTVSLSRTPAPTPDNARGERELLIDDNVKIIGRLRVTGDVEPNIETGGGGG